VTGPTSVEYIKKNIKLDDSASLAASTESSKEVVRICTVYAQLACSTSHRHLLLRPGFAFLSARFTDRCLLVLHQLPDRDRRLRPLPGLFMPMPAGAGQRKKVVEVDLRKGTPLHAPPLLATPSATLQGHSSVALNRSSVHHPFRHPGHGNRDRTRHERFRLLRRVHIPSDRLFFVYRSFYSMRILWKRRSNEVTIGLKTGTGSEKIRSFFLASSDD